MLKLTIETENAAFADNMAGECARIMRAMADRIERAGTDRQEMLARDINGNTCAHLILTTESE